MHVNPVCVVSTSVIVVDADVAPPCVGMISRETLVAAADLHGDDDRHTPWWTTITTRQTYTYTHIQSAHSTDTQETHSDKKPITEVPCDISCSHSFPISSNPSTSERESERERERGSERVTEKGSGRERATEKERERHYLVVHLLLSQLRKAPPLYHLLSNHWWSTHKRLAHTDRARRKRAS